MNYLRKLLKVYEDKCIPTGTCVPDKAPKEISQMLLKQKFFEEPMNEFLKGSGASDAWGYSANNV